MGTVRVEDFPSDTNRDNFLHDMQKILPGVTIDADGLSDALVIDVDDYEADREQIAEFAREAGGIIHYV